MIPHKSRFFWAILDMSFSIRLKNGKLLPSVNKLSVKTSPQGGINQLGNSLMQMIHAFTQVDRDMKIFMEKWYIKDGFLAFKLRIGKRMEFRICLAASRGWTSEAGGTNFPPDGVDRITIVFLCSVWNCKRFGSKICQDTSGHIAQPQVRWTFFPGRGIWVTDRDWNWKPPLRYQVFLDDYIHLDITTSQ